jgi:hypothetical protein
VQIQRTVDIAPPLRLREGDPDGRGTGAGSEVASCVTLAFLTALFDTGVVLMLVLLLLRHPAMAMLFSVDGWVAHGRWVSGCGDDEKKVAWLSAPS